MASTQEKLDMALDQIAENNNESSNTTTTNNNNNGSYGKSERGRGRGRSNHRPYNRGPRRYEESEPQAEAGSVLKISAGSDPRSVAGAVSHISRESDCPALLAIGATSINQAVKAVAIARGYLEENKIEVTCYPEFRADKRAGLKLVLVKSVRRAAAANEPEMQALKVSRDSVPGTVAGAIAKKIRENQRVCVLAIGAECVTNAVRAVFLGRKYLTEDGMDISFRPEFTKVKFTDGRDCSAVKLVILSQQI